MLRALLIVLLGMNIGPAIVTISLFYIAHGFIAGEPLDGGGWASARTSLECGLPPFLRYF